MIRKAVELYKRQDPRVKLAIKLGILWELSQVVIGAIAAAQIVIAYLHYRGVA